MGVTRAFHLLVLLASALAACAEDREAAPDPTGADRLSAHLAGGGSAVAFLADLPDTPRCRRVVSGWSILNDGRFGRLYVGREPASRRNAVTTADGETLHTVELPVSGTYGLRFLGCLDMAGRLMGTERALGVVEVGAGEAAFAGRIDMPDLPFRGLDLRVVLEDGVEIPAVDGLVASRLKRVDTVLSDGDSQRLDGLRADIAQADTAHAAWEGFRADLLGTYRDDKTAFERLDRESRQAGTQGDTLYWGLLNDLRYLRAVAAKMPAMEEVALGPLERFEVIADAAGSVGEAASASQAARAELRTLIDRHRPTVRAPAEPDYGLLDNLLPPATTDEVRAVR